MHSRAGRAARGWIVALVATTIAAASHGLADGAPPTAFGFGASLLMAGALCSVLSARTVSLWRLTLSVGLSQLAFHALFSRLSSPTAAAHGAHDPLAVAVESAGHGHTEMWLAHTIAGVFTLVLLHHAETAFDSLERLVRLLLHRLVQAPRISTEAAPARATPTGRDVTPLPCVEITSALRYRGPPRALRAV